MADQVVQITAGSGTKVDVSELMVGANTVERQRMVITDDATAAALAKVQNAAPGNSDYGLTVRPLTTVASGAKTNVAGSATSVTILASNTSRKGAAVFNDSTVNLYLDLTGGTASTTSYTVKVAPGQYFELNATPVYTAAITGIWDSATGNARVTEWS